MLHDQLIQKLWPKETHRHKHTQTDRHTHTHTDDENITSTAYAGGNYHRHSFIPLFKMLNLKV